MRFVTIALTAGIAVPAWAGKSSSVTVFFHNDGNWTRHGQQPSALFVNKPSTHSDAVRTCSSYNETLLSCHDLSDFLADFTYQQYLGNIASDQLLWSSCHSVLPTTYQGNVMSQEISNPVLLPFVCSNTAPFVTEVDTDYTPFPRVNTRVVNGTTFQGLRDHMAFRFMGIPFAQPPVDDFRFKYAQPWTGDSVNATRYGPACLQVGYFEGNANGLNPWGNSEDCLYLNIYTPSLPVDSPDDKSLKPVMLWIHGGGMVSGTGSDSTFDGGSLVSRGDVVLVTVNYRLNIFGLLSLDDDALPGNYGLSDKIAALSWVQKYITAFGGDPNKVTVFGQSAGGASVVDLIISPKAAGLFHGAIAQSIGGQVATQGDAAAAVLPYLQSLYNGTDQGRLQCLQKVPVETLLNISQVSSWHTVVDGIYVTDLPVDQVRKGSNAINPIHFMAGTMPEEAQSLLQTSLAPNASSFNTSLEFLVLSGLINEEQANAIVASGLWQIPQHYDSVYNASVNIATDTIIVCYAEEFVSVGSTANSYESLWAYRHQRAYGLSYYDFYGLCTFPVGQSDTPYYRCHSGDLYEVFGTYYFFHLPIRVPEDIYYTNAVQDMWASFAWTGDPNVEEEYLIARHYYSSLAFFEGWKWDQYPYSSSGNGVANLQWPTPYYSTLADTDHCEVLGLVET